MSALILGAGALVAVDRDDRAMMARLRASRQHGLDLRANAMVVAQVSRDPDGRQANLARLLQAVDATGTAASSRVRRGTSSLRDPDGPRRQPRRAAGSARGV